MIGAGGPFTEQVRAFFNGGVFMNMEFDLDTQHESKIVAVPVGEESFINEELKNEIEAIPQRLAFKIGEVAQMASVKPYVLRYWESEFGVLKPKKSSNNQRVYQKRDVEYVLMIKKLLYKDKYSIEGAKAALTRYRKQIKKAEALFESRGRVDSIIERARKIVNDIDHCLEMVK